MTEYSFEKPLQYNDRPKVLGTSSFVNPLEENGRLVSAFGEIDLPADGELVYADGRPTVLGETEYQNPLRVDGVIKSVFGEVSLSDDGPTDTSGLVRSMEQIVTGNRQAPEENAVLLDETDQIEEVIENMPRTLAHCAKQYQSQLGREYCARGGSYTLHKMISHNNSVETTEGSEFSEELKRLSSAVDAFTGCHNPQTDAELDAYLRDEVVPLLEHTGFTYMALLGYTQGFAKSLEDYNNLRDVQFERRLDALKEVMREVVLAKEPIEFADWIKNSVQPPENPDQLSHNGDLELQSDIPPKFKKDVLDGRNVITGLFHEYFMDDGDLNFSRLYRFITACDSEARQELSGDYKDSSYYKIARWMTVVMVSENREKQMKRGVDPFNSLQTAVLDSYMQGKSQESDPFIYVHRRAHYYQKELLFGNVAA